MRNKNIVCAVLGKPHYKGINGHHNSKSNTTKLWRVLLDSGSDGDVLFQDKNSKSTVPYKMRLKPQLWQSSMGHFTTEKLGSGIELEFPEYSENKRLNLEPDIMEYDGNTFKPKFDLRIGTKTMKELGIKLDFENDLITIDKIPMPMRSIK